MENQNYPKGQFEDTVLVCCLSLERCRIYLAHLHAIMHLLGRQAQTEGPGCASTRALMEGLEKELNSSLSHLGRALK